MTLTLPISPTDRIMRHMKIRTRAFLTTTNKHLSHAAFPISAHRKCGFTAFRKFDGQYQSAIVKQINLCYNRLR